MEVNLKFFPFKGNNEMKPSSKNTTHGEKKAVYDKDFFFSIQQNKTTEMAKTNIEYAAKYILQLYCKKNRIYSCSCTKLSKMLAIAELKYLVLYDDALFEDDIEIENCGVNYAFLSKNFITNIISGSQEDCSDCVNMADDISSAPLSLEGAASYDAQEFVFKGEISNTVIQILKDVFLSFGNVKSRALGLMIDRFKYAIANAAYLAVDKKKVRAFFSNIDNLNERNTYIDSIDGKTRNNTVMYYIFGANQNG